MLEHYFSDKPGFFWSVWITSTPHTARKTRTSKGIKPEHVQFQQPVKNAEDQDRAVDHAVQSRPVSDTVSGSVTDLF